MVDLARLTSCISLHGLIKIIQLYLYGQKYIDLLYTYIHNKLGSLEPQL